ncbi:MAG: MoeA C-terminal region (domain IV) [halophilic archaeon J07HB67]|nr:MAG: MoeA C-terminal region (domain IV) [halophilic archaeon J07HB67]
MSARSAAGLADGWVVVPESREGIDAGERVAVEHWEHPPTATGGETA